MKPPSKRFAPGGLSERLVPAILVLLVVLLVATILVVLLSMAGVFAG